MVLAIFILVFLVLGLAYFCAYLYGHYRRAMKNEETAVQMADQALQEKKQWEAYGLAAKEENEVLAKYRVILDVDAHIHQIQGEAEARLAAIEAEVLQKEEILKGAENKALAEIHIKIQKAEEESQKRIELAKQEISAAEQEFQTKKKAAEWELEYAKEESERKITLEKSILEEKQGELKRVQELLTATKNIVEGYGNEYLVPKDALFDQLAEQYGHEKAGQKLKEARDIVRTMIRKGTAASSRIGDKEQNEAAKDFIVDAFNGRVEGILAKAKRLTENYGVLRQQIKDSFSVVNESGSYVGTEITKEFLEARMDELKWAMKVQEIIEEEKEEQRILKERLRDEALARKEAEKAKKEAERQAEEDRKNKEEAENEARKRRELEEEIRARVEATQRELLAKQQSEASDAERHKIQDELNKLNAKLEAEQKMREEAEGKIGDLEQRILEAEKKRDTIASNPRGKIYIISNIGSFGEHIYKIGLTRREIEERIKELGDASVPFEFDIHAVIKTNNAPELESKLHQKLSIYRLNKSNWRKEFFKITIEELKKLIEEEGHETSWTMKAKALQYHETKEIERRIDDDEEFREQWLSRQAKLDLWAESQTARDNAGENSEIS